MEIFKENYMVTGLPLNTKPDWDTNDLTYQISARFNVARDIQHQGWDLFFAYTQLALWDVYKPSNPFKANTYQYGLYLDKLYDRRQDGLTREFMAGFEHRSNGMDGDNNRALSYVFASYTWDLSRILSAQVTGRIGLGGMGNDTSMDLFTYYQGFVNLGVCLHTPDRRLMAMASVTPMIHGKIPMNAHVEIAFNPMKDLDWFYLTVRYHYGYDEDQLECGQNDVFLKHMLRFGFSAQPRRMAHKLFF